MPTDQYVDAVYNDNFYYIHEYSTGIWRKSIDTSDPTLWCQIKLTNTVGKQLRLGNHGRSIIANREKKSIAIIEILRFGLKGEEFDIVKNFGGEIADHQPLGPEEDQVAVLTYDGWIIVYAFDLRARSYKLLDRFKIELKSNRKEKALTLTICSRSKYFLVHVKNGNSNSSRMFILELNDGYLSQRSCLDIEKEKFDRINAIKFYDFYSNHLFLCAMTCGPNSKILTYDFNTKSGSFAERKDLRKETDCVQPIKMTLLRGDLYCSDKKARLIQISYLE